MRGISTKGPLTLTKSRLTSHKLRIELDGYNRNRTPRDLRYCILCGR